MFVSLLPDTNDFNKTREWAEVRNALAGLGEDVSVVKIPKSKRFSGEVGLFDTHRCLLDSTKDDADNTAAFLELNRIQVVCSTSPIDPDNYAYDWRTNILWLGKVNQDIVQFYSRSNVEVRVLEVDGPLRSFLTIGLNGDCAIVPTAFSDMQISDLERCYSAIEVNDDLRGLIIVDKGFCYDHTISAATTSKLMSKYRRATKVDLTQTNEKLNTVVTPIIA